MSQNLGQKSYEYKDQDNTLYINAGLLHRSR